MTLTRMFFSGVALTLAIFCGATNAQEANAPQEQDGVAVSGAKLDESIFDVPDGKDVAFYRERLETIGKTIQGLANPSPETVAKINELLPNAYLVIFKNLRDDPEAEPAERNQYFQLYAILLTRNGDWDELDKLLAEEQAKDEPIQQRIEVLNAFIASGKLRKAVASKDEAAIQKLADECIANALKPGGDLGSILEFADEIGDLDDAATVAFLDKAIDALQKSGDEAHKTFVEERLLPLKRYAGLVGNEILVEGLFLDGSEIDWKAYRGKVVLIDFFATWCGPCMQEVPGILENYKKYNKAGFDVISYSVDQDLDALRTYEEKEKHPWKTASEKLSVETKTDDGKQKYQALSDYYGINSIPRMILVGKDGKVLSTTARGPQLTKLLQEQFPDVK